MTRRHRRKIWLSVLCASLGWAGLAHAQNNAGLFGEVVDVSKGNAPIADAIVVVTSPNLQGEQTTMSDDRGQYRVDQLPPGDYTVKVVAPGFKEFNIEGVRLLVGRQVKVPVGMLPEVITGETIQVTQVTSTIDQSSATAGMTVTKDYLDRVTTKRSFDAVSEATPGAQGDFYGTSFNGSTSPENATLIDGINVAAANYGVNLLSLPPEFFDQIDIKTGGYLPEYGQAMGGFVDSVLKMGGNEFHGSVFSYTTPLRLPRIPVGRIGEAISATNSLNIRQEIGFEIGGPIVKDKLWFHVGFAPRVEVLRYKKSFYRQIADAAGNPVVDDNNLPTVERIQGADRGYNQTTQTYRYSAKLTLNINEDNRISLSTVGDPQLENGWHPDYSPAGGANGDEGTFLMGRRTGTYTGLLDYDGKFLDKRLLVNVKLSYNQSDTLDLVPAGGRGYLLTHNQTYSITDLDDDPILAGACGTFANGDPRCPVTGYTSGGIGFNEYIRAERYAARGTVAYLLNLLGSHTLKGGFEFQRNQTYHRTAYTQGASVSDLDDPTFGPSYQDSRRFGYILNPDGDPLDDSNVQYDNERINSVYGHNYIAFLQDSWNIDRINVNINGGVRLDFQEIFGQGDGLPPGKYQRYIALQNWQPRIGITWDFLGNGRSKIFGSYGRFNEQVPLDIAVRNFPFESQVVTTREKCDLPNKLDCPAVDRFAYGGTPTAIIQPMRGQFVDTYTAGIEYQVLNDLLIGGSYVNSSMGNVIEDFSTDDGASFFLGNPGIGDAKKVTTADRVTGATKTVTYPVPTRKYDAMNLYVTKSLKNNWILQGSYTLSFLRGHFAGLFRPDDNQLNPNINADLDLVDLLDNSYGLLPADRTHSFKLDGAYIFEINERFAIIPNLVLRVASGTPYSYTGPHIFYGPEQSYIIQRGTAGRTDPLFQADVGIKAEYIFTKDTRLTVGLVFINVGSAQLTTVADQRYVRDDQQTVPIAGGDKSDLRFVKNLANQPAVLNTNFGNARTRQLPMELRIDAKLTF